MRVDGGSEFRGAFAAYCHNKAVALYVIPPASPTSNSKVENFNGTLRREFINFRPDLPDTIAEINAALRTFCDTHNHERPTLGLSYHDGKTVRFFTPMQYIYYHHHTGLDLHT